MTSEPQSVLKSPELFHVGFLVADIEAARSQFEAALGIGFHPATEVDLMVETMHHPDPHPYRSKLCYSTTGPVYVELVQADDSDYKSLSQGERIHHLGYWVEDVDAWRDRQSQEGLRDEVIVRYEGSDRIRQWFTDPVSMHGVRAEYFDDAWRPDFEAWMADWSRGASTLGRST
ncbi:VOC family protein [Pseudarthrobacter sp. H2]|uniref:VOC family protein n=1 Tax=Pseudarthrobacter sp. H2 TaxID=3418415 RepID=UPI003CF8864A